MFKQIHTDCGHIMYKGKAPRISCLFSCRRYYICDNKLNTLDWREKTPWEEGLKKTIDWYLQHGFKEFWDNGDVEAALQPHPVMHPQQMLAGATVTSP